MWPLPALDHIIPASKQRCLLSSESRYICLQFILWPPREKSYDQVPVKWTFSCWMLYFGKNNLPAGQWWYTPLIPALGRQRQADFWVRGQPGPQCEFQDSQGYTEKSCLENKTKKKKKQKTKKSTTINKTLWNLHKAQLNHWWHWTMCLFDTSTVMALVTCRQSWFPQLHIFLGDSEAKRESTWASGSSWQSLCDVL